MKRTKGPKLMTQRAFVNDSGACCPVCRSPQVDFGTIDVYGPFIWQRCSCLEVMCHTRWDITYRLTCYSILK